MAANGKDMGDLAVLEFTAFTALIMVVSGQVGLFRVIHSSTSDVLPTLSIKSL